MHATALRQSHWIRAPASSPSCHAATLAETPQGLICAFFAGSDEGAGDVAIWVSRQAGGRWSAAKAVARAADTADACWNPVLYAHPGGPLLLFYKTGPSCAHWQGMLMRSTNDGLDWTPGRRLPSGIIGPSRNKPLALEDGTLLCPSSTEDQGWRIHLEFTSDLGETWTRTAPLNDGRRLGAIQPTVVRRGDGRLHLLCRTQQGYVAESRSADGGLTWTALRPAALPNPCSGIDAVSLRDGRIALAYNHATLAQRGAWGPRTPLNLALSADGRHWQAALVLESTSGEYSYPAMIQTRDGLLHVAYTWRRTCIRHLALDPARLAQVPITAGRWPDGVPQAAPA